MVGYGNRTLGPDLGVRTSVSGPGSYSMGGGGEVTKVMVGYGNRTMGPDLGVRTGVSRFRNSAQSCPIALKPLP